MKFVLFLCISLMALFSFIALAQEDTSTTGTANSANQSSSSTVDQNQPQSQPADTAGNAATTGSTEKSPATSATETTGAGNTTTDSSTAGAGATGTIGSSATPAPSEAPKLEVTERGKTIASFTGNGNQKTKAFNLKAGAATFEVRLNWERPDTSLTQNEGNFEVVLVDQNNKPADTVIATIDYFDGARTINIPADGLYTLQVKAPGNWSVKIDQ